MLNTYNFEPKLCMKRKFTVLTTLISGPKQPGNNIDVYLAPLIEDLNTLWHKGVKAYDAFRQESFTLRAILLWIINDFPAYGYLSGSVVQGYNACPICSEKRIPSDYNTVASAFIWDIGDTFHKTIHFEARKRLLTVSKSSKPPLNL